MIIQGILGYSSFMTNPKLHLASKVCQESTKWIWKKLKKIRNDNGKEFDNTNIEAYCDEVGIKHEVSATYTPQQNGVVERKNQTLITLARTMLDEYNSLKALWAEAINTACYASNRLFLQSSLARHLMSCSMGRSQTSLSLGCLVANATSTKRGNT